jgi:hypothetical protein
MFSFWFKWANKMGYVLKTCKLFFQSVIIQYSDKRCISIYLTILNSTQIAKKALEYREYPRASFLLIKQTALVTFILCAPPLFLYISVPSSAYWLCHLFIVLILILKTFFVASKV